MYQLSRPMSWAAARVDAGLTQEDVASALRITKNTLIAWEKGTSEPKVSQAKALCELYNRPMDDIFMPEKSN